MQLRSRVYARIDACETRGRFTRLQRQNLEVTPTVRRWLTQGESTMSPIG